MLQKQITSIIAHRQCQSRAVLCAKNAGYNKGKDKLANFKDAAAFNKTTTQEALWTMVTKHIIEIKNMVLSGETPNERWIQEYVGDMHSYLYLLESIWKEQIEELYPSD